MSLPIFRFFRARTAATLAALLALGGPACAAGIELVDDTGRKLAHVEKQIAWNTGDAIVRDLSASLKEDDA